MIKKYYYVYRITNMVENKHYYGYRSTNIPPKEDLGVYYFSSSKDKNFINDQKSNPQNYKYKVIIVCSSSKKALLFEIKLHTKFDVGINPYFYNRAKQTSVGFDTTGIPISDAHRQAISNAGKGRPNPNKGKPASEATKLKMSLARRNRPSNRKGCTLTNEMKERLSKALLGNKNSLGVKHSEETRLKVSKATSGANNPKAKKANVYDYASGECIAKDVVLKVWCRENGYDQGCMSRTAHSNHELPASSTNLHKHKGVYARYSQST
jgi:hypothetical protein